MTLTTLAKISAAYLGVAVAIATGSVVWETGKQLAGPYSGPGLSIAEAGSPE